MPPLFSQSAPPKSISLPPLVARNHIHVYKGAPYSRTFCSHGQWFMNSSNQCCHQPPATSHQPPATTSKSIANVAHTYARCIPCAHRFQLRICAESTQAGSSDGVRGIPLCVGAALGCDDSFALLEALLLRALPMHRPKRVVNSCLEMPYVHVRKLDAQLLQGRHLITGHTSGHTSGHQGIRTRRGTVASWKGVEECHLRPVRRPTAVQMHSSHTTRHGASTYRKLDLDGAP